MGEKINKCSDTTLSASIIFALILISDILAIIMGFGGSFVGMFSGDGGMFSSYESLIISSAVICGVLMTVLYSYKNNHRKKIIAIGLANLIISLAPYILNSVYYPFSFMVTDFLFDISSSYHDLRFLTGELISVPLCILCIILSIRMKRKDQTKNIGKNTYKKLLALTVFFFVFVNIFNFFITTFGISDMFNYSTIGYYLQNWKQHNELEAYNSITESMSISEVNDLLINYGFFPHTQIEEYIDDEEELEFELDALKEYIVNGDETVYTKPDSYGYVSYYNPCIIISAEPSGIVKKKKITFDSSETYGFFDQISINEGDDICKAEEIFKSFEIGEEKETVLKQIKKYTFPYSFEAEYKDNFSVETYKFTAVEDDSFLSFYDREDFIVHLVFEGEFLKGGNCTYFHEHSDYEGESDDIVEETRKYTIE